MPDQPVELLTRPAAEREVPGHGHLTERGVPETYPDGHVERPTRDQTRLEDVMAEVHALAQRVGGLRQLAEIIQNMEHEDV
jgi:hypothetical protein